NHRALGRVTNSVHHDGFRHRYPIARKRFRELAASMRIAFVTRCVVDRTLAFRKHGRMPMSDEQVARTNVLLEHLDSKMTALVEGHGALADGQRVLTEGHHVVVARLDALTVGLSD